jgi:glucose-6-phosphate isomerase
MSPKIFYDDTCLGEWIKESECAAYTESFLAAQDMLEKRNGPGRDFLGWLDLPGKIDQAVVARVRETAEQIRKKADVLICIGIGGS